MARCSRATAPHDDSGQDLRERSRTSRRSVGRFRLGKACTRFTADIGIDDEVKGSGSAEFEVWADGKMLFDTGPTLLTGSSPVKHVDVDITGRRELRLFVGTGPNGNGQDHGDWADAMVHCAP